jgi:hypothetical protein
MPTQRIYHPVVPRNRASDMVASNDLSHVGHRAVCAAVGGDACRCTGRAPSGPADDAGKSPKEWIGPLMSATRRVRLFWAEIAFSED